ncbi:kinase-like protein [Byssothecium circinans]|uniref:Kinase-like protein n=1 Tax=Byssothecium circinans TaxID=147558 RepID=A0A6A5TIF5_9PLEO|nr:kinase-like protein [Byssothecium circinans]
MRPFLSLLSLVKAFPIQCLKKLRSPSKTHNNTILPNTIQFLAAGKSGVVYGIDPERVLKEFHDSDAGEIERRVYQRLGSHPNIAKVLDTRADGSIILERGTPLRTILRASSANEISIQTKVCWLRHAAEGYQYLHACDIIHSDIGCNNLILTGEDHVKLIDFEGCSIDGGPADSCYEWFSYCPSMPRVSQRTDIFAFGCAIYELYGNQHFPDVTNLPLGQLVQSCWCGDTRSMSEVIQELEAFRTGPLSERCCHEP